MKKTVNKLILLLTRSAGFYQVLLVAIFILIGLLMAAGVIEVKYINPYNDAR
jgi:uncharacterized membrane protein